MDHPRNAAQRIRPILQAMERSIDTARRRRTNEPEPTPGAGAGSVAGAGNGTSMTNGVSTSMHTNSSASAGMNRGMIGTQASTYTQRQAALDQTRIGGGSTTPAAQPQNPAGVIRPGDVNHQHVAQTPNPNGLQPNQPPRLKAKPKPASPFVNELDPPAYRSQAS